MKTNKSLIFKVLIENGFTPEWITLQKEIKEEWDLLRNDLLRERKYFGPYPLSVEENIKWSEIVYKYKSFVENINKKISKFNLVVPVLSKQMVHVILENEAQKVVINGKSSDDVLRFEGPSGHERLIQNNSGDAALNFFSLLDYIFKGK